MKSLFETLGEKRDSLSKNKPKFNFSNERQVLIQEAVDKINLERSGTKYKPVYWRQINGMVAHLKDFELSWFLRECHKSPIFGQAFFGRLKKR